ncbi:Glutamine amidotransferase class-I family protein [Theileria parva strain Muguga]|uniref:Glutamine amidotransferase domain-containing protein n=1 Tax=Theileria parva TaxID=5875 RepID=Q4N6K8_THEPA|nr:Glutamine amidotransferase class-I family protein [Theileria parva strain Muguga]EAN34400.1 Glutamine amidotransferase class-I family protein [Theileria parva strain Muguga]|eukprot:XP_766683.1 hypothetical protein [Theileria parva strain Muguga]
MLNENSELKILIFVPCDNDLFKERHGKLVRQWLVYVSEYYNKKINFNFTEINIIHQKIPPLNDVLKYNGLLITGGFASIGHKDPWLGELRHLIRLLFVHKFPMFGICFGFQVISQALGSSYLLAPYGFNFFALDYKLEPKASAFFKPFFNYYHRYEYNNKLNGNKTNNGVIDLNKENYNSIIGLFSHNDVITSLPDGSNIDYGSYEDQNRTEIDEALSDLVVTNISSSDKFPILGYLAGDSKRTFILSLQHHPEFHTSPGLTYFNDVLSLKLSQGLMSSDQFEKNIEMIKMFNESNSGKVYGLMTLSLFSNGYIKPEQ